MEGRSKVTLVLTHEAPGEPLKQVLSLIQHLIPCLGQALACI